MASRNLTKPFSIGGFILGEIYNFFIVFGTSPSHEVVPMAHQIKRLLSLALFCGPFGALIGLGIGLLVMACLPKRPPSGSMPAPPPPAGSQSPSTPPDHSAGGQI